MISRVRAYFEWLARSEYILHMQNTYVIAWKSKSRGSVGRGKTLFSRQDAEQLAKQLNQDHPDFIHEPVNLDPSPTVITDPEIFAAFVRAEPSPVVESSKRGRGACLNQFGTSLGYRLARASNLSGAVPFRTILIHHDPERNRNRAAKHGGPGFFETGPDSPPAQP